MCRAAHAFLLHKLSSLSFLIRLKLSSILSFFSNHNVIACIYIPHLSFTFPLFSKSLWAIYFNFCLSENFILSLFLSLVDGCALAMVMGYGLWSDGPMGWFDFVGLSSWVWVRGSSTWPAWIVKLTSVDHQLDQRGWDGSSTWSAWVSDRCYGRWNCGGWWPTIGRIAGLRQWDREGERERETVRPRGRDDEKK